MLRARLLWIFLSLLPLVACGYDLPAGGSSSIEAEGCWGSQRPGMGAQFYGDGTMFRVWAPNADRVFVTGDFNGWDMWANELGNECNGNFSADVPWAWPEQRYQFVIQRGWDTFWRNDPRAMNVTNSAGESVIYDRGSFPWRHSDHFRPPSFDEQVIYEMHIGTFYADPWHGPGNFARAVQKLDYLQWLGVNMVQLMPITEFPGDHSWGYNPAFPFAVESAYGHPNDLKWFIDEAHARGIGVILDVVYNHFGPSDLPMWCFDGECYGRGGIYFYTDWRMDTPWGPRPDFGRPQVRDYIRDNVRQWLGDFRADGLRWDATMEIRQAGGVDLPEGWSLLREINEEISHTHPHTIQIAEDHRGNPAITRPTFEGGAGFDSQWDGGFYHAVADAIIGGHDDARDLHRVRDAIAHKFNDRATQRVIYTESHDEVANGRSRMPEMIWPGNAGSWHSRKRSTLGAALVFTAPGIPMIFQGQEFLEDGYFHDDRPLDWSKADHFDGILRLYRDLIQLRRNWHNNTRGLRGNHVNVHHVNNHDKLLAYHRWQHGGPGDDVIIVANFSARTYSNYRVGMPRGGTWYVRLNSDWNGYSGDFGNAGGYDTHAHPEGRDGMPYSAEVGIGPYSVLILSQ
jgi:1,4-alpha-glucan branching enzyme